MKSKVETHGGTFFAQPVLRRGYEPYYDDKNPKRPVRGCSMEMLFRPNELVEAPKIGLTQTATAKEDGKPFFGFGRDLDEKEKAARSNKKEKGQGDEGRFVDANAGDTNPLYG